MSVSVAKVTAEKDAALYKAYMENQVNKTGKRLTYGTAGFRNLATNLEHVCLRVGIFSGIVAKIDKKKVLGVCVTASHNPVQDNGLKQTDFDGGMLRRPLEGAVEKFCNTEDLGEAIKDLIQTCSQWDSFDLETQSCVFLGRDTRPSSPGLVALLSEGVKSIGAQVKDFGETTTPQLHFFVRHFNLDSHFFTRETPISEMFPAYFKELSTPFKLFMDSLGYQKDSKRPLILDCANGVGGVYKQQIADIMKPYYDLTIINSDDIKFLNDGCGAEHVHKSQTYSRNSKEILSKADKDQNFRVAAFDGDADRIVYFLPTEGLNEIKLLDGDREICLWAKFYKTALAKVNETANKLNSSGLFFVNQDFSSWTVGMVQTAYANGGSTQWLQNVLKVESCYMPTGVKNLHPAAHKYDFGIYCESNGHGMFTWNTDKIKHLEAIISQVQSLLGNPIVKKGSDTYGLLETFLLQLNQLYWFSKQENQTVGDAITDLFCVEAALAYLKINSDDWYAFYNDRKCLNHKVAVKDRSKIKTIFSEERVLEPIAIQDAIDQLTKENPGTRSFVRPSGTEDFVRIYSEGDDKKVIEGIRDKIEKILKENKDIN